ASTIRTLELMGVRPARARGRFILNSHFSNYVHVARIVAGDRWPEVAYAAGLVQYIEQDAPNDEQLSSPVESLSRLNEAIETILRWAGLANDWYVEEVECGSVTGTFDCAFAIRSAENI